MKPTHKICKTCGLDKSVRSFYRRSGGNGLRSACKQCHNRAVNENRLLKIEYYSAKKREYHADPINRAKHIERCKRYSQTDRGRALAAERRKAWAVTHPEQHARIMREQWRRRTEQRRQQREQRYV